MSIGEITREIYSFYATPINRLNIVYYSHSCIISGLDSEFRRDGKLREGQMSLMISKTKYLSQKNLPFFIQNRVIIFDEI